MRKRAELLQLADSDPSAIPAIIEMCRRDPVFFIDHFLWTYDPRSTQRHRPFILYEFQEEELAAAEAAYRGDQDMLTEKSRDMGVTWYYAAWIFHKWMFEKDFTCLIGSRKEDLVDNRQGDSIFGKFDYMMRYMPPWLIPAGWQPSKHRLALKYINPENSNSILGESANPDFSRGGRYSLIFFDEFAFWDWADGAWMSAGDATKVRFAVSTPNGANFFKSLRFSGRILVRTVKWDRHPEKDQVWYDKERQRRSSEEMAQEIDIAYDKSNKGRVYEEFEYVPYDAYPYEDRWPLYVSWDYGLGDDTAMIWWQRDPTDGRRRIIDVYWNRGKLIDFYVPFITGEIPTPSVYHYKDEDIKIINDHARYKPGIHFGDPSGKQRHQAGGNKSVIEQLRMFGIHVHTKDDANDFQIRKTKSKLLMRDLEVNDNERTRYLRECMLNCRYPVRRDNTQATTVPDKPIHDWTSHLRTAFEYYAVNERDYRLRTSVDTMRFQQQGGSTTKTILY